MSGKLPTRRTNPVRGLLLLAIGRAEGFALMGSDTRSYLNSLAPWVALSLVVGAFTALGGEPVQGAAGFCASLSGWLAPAVVADALCRRWQRTAYWALFATLLNWTPLLIGAALPLAVLLAIILAAAGLPAAASAGCVTLAMLCYATWFQWFTARGALRLTRWQTVWLLLAIQLVMGMLLALEVATGLLSLDPLKHLQ